MLKLTIAALAAMLLTACGSPEKRTEKQQEKTILCGGYTRQRPGTNYRFICTAKTATPGPETYEAEIIVFQPLPGQGEAKIAKITRL